MRVSNRFSFCESLRVEKLVSFPRQPAGIPEKLYLLDIREEVRLCLNSVMTVLGKDVYCGPYFAEKVRETIFLMDLLYDRTELSCLFAPALSPDSFFSTFVIQNSHRYRTVPELAEAMNYSVSGFSKRFFRLFGTSPYRWGDRNQITGGIAGG